MQQDQIVDRGLAAVDAPAKVTVLMAVRNGEPFLNVAIDSILRQTIVIFVFLSSMTHQRIELAN